MVTGACRVGPSFMSPSLSFSAPMKTYPIVVSCDWFAYSCSTEGGVLPELEVRIDDSISARSFHFVESQEHHPFYECSCLAKEGNAPVAHLFYRCKRSDHPFSAQIKVDNSRLYYSHWADSLHALLRALHWRVMFVNRIDICADFNYFANGRLPLSFAQDYLSKPYKGHPSFIRHSSNKLRTVVTRSLHSLRYETLSWGTRDSAVQTNLYNKSLELEEKCDKPWIRQRWIENGLLHGEIEGKRFDVWRVEFSINPSALMVQNAKTGDAVGQLNINNVCDPAALIETWELLHPRYFTFHFLTKEAADNPEVRVRDLPIVTLFERHNCCKYKVKGVQYFRKSTRTDKLLIRRLLDSIESDQLDSNERKAFAAVVDHLLRLYWQKSERLSKLNLAEDTLTLYLQGCFAQISPSLQEATATHSATTRRRARMWARMLQGAHDTDFDRFSDALRQLEELSGTTAFEDCMRYANYVCGTTLPDDGISEWVDDEILREAYCMPSLNPQEHPAECGTQEPFNTN